MPGLTRTIVLALAAVNAAVASPIQARTPYEVKETHFVPRKWKRVERAPKDHVIHLQIGVRQNNFAELEKRLYEVSSPSNHRYGDHLSKEQVDELVRPRQESSDLVHEWLNLNNIIPTAYSSAKDWISITLPVEGIESLLDTEYHVFEHEDGSRVARTTEWSLPAHLHGHIDTIQPTTSFFRASPKIYEHIDSPGAVYLESDYKPPKDPEIAKVCNASSVTPQCFETLYRTKGYKTQSDGSNKVAFTNYLGEHPVRTDLALFLKKYAPEAVSQAKDFKQFVIADGPGDGPLTPAELAASTSKEANLDVQAIAGISWKTPIISYSTGGSPPFNPSKSTPTNTNEPYVEWLNYVLGLKSIPQVISTSYADDEQTVPQDYAKRVCALFAQLGARGTSVLFASGDDGVGPSDPAECVSNDGKNTTKFLPLFPSSCPYVTTVGATKNFQPEEVAYRPAFVGPDGRQRGNYTSGGGFSNYFETPDYQERAVKDYLKHTLKDKFKGLYNPKGRAYPDIAAQGLYFAYFWNGTEGVISGTSASTPLLAGILTLVNDALEEAGKKPLGFLNPWLYERGFRALNDIVIGSAHGCNTDGFPAAEGWDPVTGFGTPDFRKLVDITGGEIGGHHGDD